MVLRDVFRDFHLTLNAWIEIAQKDQRVSWALILYFPVATILAVMLTGRLVPGGTLRFMRSSLRFLIQIYLDTLQLHRCLHSHGKKHLKT
jgi:hypothetical protein